MIKSNSFQTLFLLNCFTQLSGIFVIGVYQNVGYDRNYSSYKLNMTSYAAAIMSFLGRFISAIMVD